MVMIEGGRKLGNFTLGFTDWEIATPGVPLTVTRTDDTLDAGRDLDFGHGWSLQLGLGSGTADFRIGRGKFQLVAKRTPANTEICGA